MTKSAFSSVWCMLVAFIFMQACRSRNEIRDARYYANGKNIYEKHCANCHGMKGEGLGTLYPSLTDSTYLKENRSKLACIIRFGKQDTTSVTRHTMPANTTLTPIDIAYVIHYISNSFGNKAAFYSQEQVAKDLRQCD